MGAVYAHNIENAAKRILAILAERDFVDYSEFYDGSDERSLALRVEIGLEPDDEWNCPELLVDVAVAQLSKQGVVTTTKLRSKLADDEPDYRIAWTERAPELVKQGLRFWDADL